MSLPAKILDQSWDYRGQFTKPCTHGFHSYPAMMIPQVASRLIETYGAPGNILLDPFCGSGSVLVEAMRHGLDSWGVDLNPLAILVARVKTTPLDPALLRQEYSRLLQRMETSHGDSVMPDFFNLDYWFKPDVIASLARIKASIDGLDLSGPVRDFFLVAFSEAVRLSSNSRSHEFKLFRYAPARLETHSPSPDTIFRKKVERNIAGMAELWASASGRRNWARPIEADATAPLPIPPESVDLIVTSPPYGDSRTTVAYGQFSRLSAQWLGFDDLASRNLDTRLMGGAPSPSLENDLPSPALQLALERITLKDGLRARQVLSFYADLHRALGQILTLSKPGARACFVVGNRRVKSVQIMTDEIIAEMGEQLGFTCETIIVRSIPSKTMPLKNSPSNKVGDRQETMHREHIVVLRKNHS